MATMDVSALTQALGNTRKYAHLCPQTLDRIAGWAALRHARQDQALKAAKRKLHQIFASYQNDELRKLPDWLEQTDWNQSRSVEALCLRVMRLHASSAERLGHLAELYERLWAIMGTPQTLTDLGGGLNAFALPWMRLPPETLYWATEIDTRQVAAIDRLLTGLRRPGAACCHDLLVHPWNQPVDVAMLLKVAPCLEQQEPGATLRLLAALPARWIVVSFPSRSLGGRAKGMEEHYRQQMARWAAALGRPLQELVFPGEVYYLLPGMGHGWPWHDDVLKTFQP